MDSKIFQRTVRIYAMWFNRKQRISTFVQDRKVIDHLAARDDILVNAKNLEGANGIPRNCNSSTIGFDCFPRFKNSCFITQLFEGNSTRESGNAASNNGDSFFHAIVLLILM